MKFKKKYISCAWQAADLQIMVELLIKNFYSMVDIPIPPPPKKKDNPKQNKEFL